MIDIHAHILPGYDDGASNISDAVIMAEAASESGVTAITATPHVLEDRLPSIPKLYDSVEMLQEKLIAASVSLTLFPGMEIMATEKTANLLASGKLITLNGSRYPLLEFGFNETAEYMASVLSAVQSEGYSPVLAHPERYFAFHDAPEKALRLAEKGILLQLDKDSIFGRMGRGAGATAAFLLQEKCIHVVASDAHRPHYRTARLTRAQEHVALNYSFEYARLLFEENPLAILQNRPAVRF